MPKNMKKWTDEEVEMLAQEWPDKAARKELAVKLGRTIPALRVKYENMKPKEEGSPKKKQPRKNKGSKIPPKFATPAKNLAAAAPAAAPAPVDVQPTQAVELPVIHGNEAARLKELIESYFKEKKNATIADTSSLMLEGAMIKGMRQMLQLVHRAGYCSAPDIEKLTKVLAKYEKKLMWDALKEHFVSNQDED